MAIPQIDPEKEQFQGQKIKENSFMSLVIRLEQQGNELSGTCSNKVRYEWEGDESSFTTTIKGKVAQLEIESTLGGKAIIRLTAHKNRLYWNVIKIDNSKGEFWFPQTATLQREYYPSLRGISTGSDQKEVLKTFGKASHKTLLPPDDCRESIRLKYPGLEIDICKEMPEPFVWHMTVTGKHWRMSGGLRVGLTDNEVENIVRIPDWRYIDEEQGYEVLSYSFEGVGSFFRIYLSNYAVVKIEIGIKDQ
jgi:hypothetical protein